MKKYSKKHKLLVIASVGVLVGAMAACSSTATPTGSCAYVVGNGQDGADAKVHEIAFPGENNDLGSDEIAQYVPCGPRNYITSDGTLQDASGHKIGDRFKPFIGYTKEGTKVNVYPAAYFTLNESKDVMLKFYPFCFKYQCFGSDSTSGTDSRSNFGTKGWNGLLGENFNIAIDSMVKSELPSFDDSIWKNHDAKQWKKLSDQMSDDFADEIRGVTGVSDDFFCGSGNSGWSNPDKPGEGTFTCSQVRFKIIALEAADQKVQDQEQAESRATKQKIVNDKELEAAKARYGKDAGYWLGLQDTLKACQKAGTCYVVLGGNGGTSPSVSIPMPSEQAPKK